MRGLWHLAWLELKIFLREPMGAFGTVAVPALVFFGAHLAGTSVAPQRFRDSEFARTGLPVLAATFMTITAVLSLMTIIAIYREGGILKRLRATPLRPLTILLAHVLVKLALTAVTLVVLAIAGRRFVALPEGVSMLSFGAALLYATACLLSLGFLLASFVPTARFAQPLGALVLYPMVAVSGLFVPLEEFPTTLQHVAQVLPFTHAVALMQGIWAGDAWGAHLTDVAALFATAVVCSALASRVFRWE
jgi:ABC-2 type transport system permease protein